MESVKMSQISQKTKKKRKNKKKKKGDGYENTEFDESLLDQLVVNFN